MVSRRCRTPNCRHHHPWGLGSFRGCPIDEGDFNEVVRSTRRRQDDHHDRRPVPSGTIRAAIGQQRGNQRRENTYVTIRHSFCDLFAITLRLRAWIGRLLRLARRAAKSLAGVTTLALLRISADLCTASAATINDCKQFWFACDRKNRPVAFHSREICRDKDDTCDG